MKDYLILLKIMATKNNTAKNCIFWRYFNFTCQFVMYFLLINTNSSPILSINLKSFLVELEKLLNYLFKLVFSFLA